MTTTFEYIRLYLDMGDLSELNSLSSTGWRVVSLFLDTRTSDRPYVALLERPLEEQPKWETPGNVLCPACEGNGVRNIPGGIATCVFCRGAGEMRRLE